MFVYPEYTSRLNFLLESIFQLQTSSDSNPSKGLELGVDWESFCVFGWLVYMAYFRTGKSGSEMGVNLGNMFD